MHRFQAQAEHKSTSAERLIRLRNMGLGPAPARYPALSGNAHRARSARQRLARGRGAATASLRGRDGTELRSGSLRPQRGVRDGVHAARVRCPKRLHRLTWAGRCCHGRHAAKRAPAGAGDLFRVAAALPKAVLGFSHSNLGTHPTSQTSARVRRARHVHVRPSRHLAERFRRRARSTAQVLPLCAGLNENDLSGNALATRAPSCSPPRSMKTPEA